MKCWLFLIMVLSLSLCGCATVREGGLPQQRPADLVITYYSGGGMLDQSETYYISQDSAIRNSRYQGHQNRWLCQPSAQRLDALYAQLLQDEVSTIKTENLGQVYDRGGITMRFSYGGKSFEIADAGSDFVVEKDQERFRRTTDGLIGLVEECLLSQKIPVQIDLQAAVVDAAVQSCSVRLDNNAVVNWQAQMAAPLADVRTANLLPGNYELEASAQVGEKWVSLHWPVEITAEKHDFQLLLKTIVLPFKKNNHHV